MYVYTCHNISHLPLLPPAPLSHLSLSLSLSSEDRTERLRAMLAADKASSHEQDTKLTTLRAGATQLKEIFNKGLGVVDPKAAPSAEAAAASSSCPITRVSSAPDKQTATFEEKVCKIAGARGNLSPRSQRLLGGLSGASYKNIKADHIPSERAKIEAAARYTKTKKIKFKKRITSRPRGPRSNLLQGIISTLCSLCGDFKQ